MHRLQASLLTLRYTGSAAADRIAVERALKLAGMEDLKDVPVNHLSGGQRQRAWIAMALAQETPIVLLGEPTTCLDVTHQQEVLSLIHRLNRDEGRTIVLVLHDVTSATQVSDHVVAMRDGRIVEEGPPHAVLTSTLLESVFGVACDPRERRVIRVHDVRSPWADGV